MGVVSKPEFAKIAGVDRSAVTRWVQSGLPTLPGGNIDPVVASEWVRSNVANYAVRRTNGAGQMQRAERERLHTSLAWNLAEDVSLVKRKLFPLLQGRLPLADVREVIAALQVDMAREQVEYLDCDADVCRPDGCRSWSEWKDFAPLLEPPSDEEWASFAAEAPRK